MVFLDELWRHQAAHLERQHVCGCVPTPLGTSAIEVNDCTRAKLYLDCVLSLGRGLRTFCGPSVDFCDSFTRFVKKRSLAELQAAGGFVLIFT